MAHNKSSFSETFKIRATEIDQAQKATLPALCNLLQEAAGNHAHQLQFDITDLQRNKLTWVLRRLHIHISRFPYWRDSITIDTWHSGSDGLRAYRDFIIRDKDGKEIGKALSYWLILDIKTRRPRRIPDDLKAHIPDDTEHVLPLSKPHFKTIDHIETQHSFNVRQSDLDMNWHVNNVHYIEWMMQCLPGDLQPTDIEIHFVGEAIQDDPIIASGYSKDEVYRIQIHRESDQEPLARACIK